MSKADLPRRPMFKSAPGAFVPVEPINTPATVNTPSRKAAGTLPPGSTPRRESSAKDRHKPGYMAEYMRKRRAAK